MKHSGGPARRVGRAGPRMFKGETAVTRGRKIRAVLLRTAILLLAAAAMILGWWHDCFLLRIFHLPCLTCGMTRSLRALLCLDWRASLRYHPLTVPFALTFWLLLNREPLGIPEGRMRRWMAVLGALLIAFWFWRIASGPSGWAFLLEDTLVRPMSGFGFLSPF